MCEEPTFKSEISGFKIRFQTNATEKKDGCFCSLLKSNLKFKLTEAMRRGAPPFDKKAAISDSSDTEKTFKWSVDTPALCGWAYGYAGTKLEYLGLAQMYYQFQGQRQLAIVPYHALEAFVADHGDMLSRNESEDLVDFYCRLLQQITVEQLTSLKSKGIYIYKALVNAGSLLYIPPGCIVSCKTIGTGNCFAFRAPVLDTSKDGVLSFLAFARIVQELDPGHMLNGYWKHVVKQYAPLSFCTKPVGADSAGASAPSEGATPPETDARSSAPSTAVAPTTDASAYY